MKKLLLLILTAVFAVSLFSQELLLESENVITTIKIDAAIGPIAIKQIKDAIKRSEKLNAEALIIQLNTPGGGLEATWDIVQLILASNVPVVVYVSPPGARAASAGVFITYAAHIAAMAPQTNIGSAHPVGMGGSQIDSTMGEKVTNDAVAKIKTLANKRGRNINWAEEAVRKSVSVTEFEAQDSLIINYIALDLDSLIAQINQDTVDLITGPCIINTENPKIIFMKSGFSNSILEIISDPNVAYILMAIGMLGIYFELSTPGAILPGVIGGISLILALFSFQALPINFAGVLLLIIAMIMFLLEIKIASHGILGGGGVIALLLGSMMLVNDAEFPYKGISLSVIIPTVIVFSAFFFLAAYLSLKAHKRKVATGDAGLVGEKGVSKTAIGPGGGKVFVHGEHWSAKSESPIEPNQKIRVEAVEGMELKVSKLDE